MAGKLTTNQIQLGDSATATQNFVLQTNVDGSAKLARGNAGATTQDILSISSGGVVTANQGLAGDGSAITGLPTPAALSTASGSAPSYSARAWVNFNGTGTVAIRASGNVSSITDNGTGDYTINFMTAMPDANFAPVITCGDTGSSALFAASQNDATSGNTTTTMRFKIKYQSGATTTVSDANICAVAIFR